MSKNFPKWYIIVLHFGENFMKIRTNIAKLQIHENLHKNVNENMFSFTFLCKFSWVLWKAIKATNMFQLYTTNFNLLKMAVQYQFFPILMVQMFFSQIQQAPHSRLQNSRKVPVITEVRNFWYIFHCAILCVKKMLFLFHASNKDTDH